MVYPLLVCLAAGLVVLWIGLEGAPPYVSAALMGFGFGAIMPTIQSIVVSTADHTHAPATVMALKSGLHVYCEKPLTHNVYEARVVAETATKNKRVTQMGTQIHAGDNYRRVVELIQTRARAAYARREIEYPIDHALTFAFGGEEGSTDNPYAADYIRMWAKAKYDVDLTIDHIRGQSLRRLRDELIGHQERMIEDGGAEAVVDSLLKAFISACSGADPPRTNFAKPR